MQFNSFNKIKHNIFSLRRPRGFEPTFHLFLVFAILEMDKASSVSSVEDFVRWFRLTAR